MRLGRGGEQRRIARRIADVFSGGGGRVVGSGGVSGVGEGRGGVGSWQRNGDRKGVDLSSIGVARRGGGVYWVA